MVTVILHLNASVNRRARRYYAPTVQNKVTIVYCRSSCPLGELPWRSVSALPPHDKDSLRYLAEHPLVVRLQPRKASTETEIYLKFVAMLKPDDYVLTFRVDVLLERTVEKAGVPRGMGEGKSYHE